MKIGIITVYNSYNCGSFLQAFALYRTLDKMGHDVYFIKRNNKMYKFTSYGLRICKNILKGNYKKVSFFFREHFKFAKYLKMLPVVENTKNMDVLVYGSDTIWNLEDKYFEKNWKRYWGFGISQKKITYAASVGSTSEDKICGNSSLCECISDFDSISVRDEHTYNIVKRILSGNSNVLIVTDPTMLLDREEYQTISKPCNEKNFILLYYFGRIPDSVMKQIKDFAHTEGKKIISFGSCEAADVNIPFDPGMMLGYYQNADYIVTNTFHGNIFSIIFNKQFISFGKEKTKVALLLQDFGLEQQLLDENNNIDSVLKNKIDYSYANKVLSNKKKESLEYLNKCVNKTINGE